MQRRVLLFKEKNANNKNFLAILSNNSYLYKI